MLRELDTLRNRIDRLFSEDDLDVRARPEGAITPALDVQETDAEILVTVSMPGIKPDDVEVHVDNNVLTVRGSTREERDETQGTWHVHERRFGSVFRSISLPAPVNDEAADASMADGVLTVRLPKTDEPRGKKITVKA
jgi:HSP20 family protein